MPRADGTVEVSARSSTTAQRPVRTDPAHAARVEAFSIKVALDLVQGRHPGLKVEPQSHSNPGFDIRVVDGENVVRFIEVKGTTRDVPTFSLSEVERRFPVEHADRFTLLVVGEIDLTQGTYTPLWHDGAIDDRFALRPTRWQGVFPS